MTGMTMIEYHIISFMAVSRMFSEHNYETIAGWFEHYGLATTGHPNPRCVFQCLRQALDPLFTGLFFSFFFLFFTQ